MKGLQQSSCTSIEPVKLMVAQSLKNSLFQKVSPDLRAFNIIVEGLYTRKSCQSNRTLPAPPSPALAPDKMTYSDHTCLTCTHFLCCSSVVR
jgi:hypothetical protein